MPSKDSIRHKLIDELEDRLNDFADEVVWEYLNSDEFKEAACQYCQDAGWKEPD